MNNNNNLTTLPFSEESERVILGSILLENDVINTVIGLLNPEDFYLSLHRAVFMSMVSLFEKSQKIDPILVVEEAKKLNVTALRANITATSVAGLALGLPYFSDISDYVNIVKDKSTLRQLVKVCSSVIEKAISEESDAKEVINSAEESIYSLTNSEIIGNLEHIKQGLLDSVAGSYSKHHAGVTVAGVPTGLYDLDVLLQGLKPGQLVVCASRPSVGKTAFSLSVLRECAKTVPVAMFSLEMASDEICERLICADANINSYVYRLGNLNASQWEDVSYSSETLGNYQGGIYLDDSPKSSLTTIKSNLRRLSYTLSGRKIGLVIVDYIGLMAVSDPKVSRETQVSQLSAGLKRIAREFNVPVLVLSQLNRNSESRITTKFRPTMSDLRESGAIEQDADVVLLLYREDMYIADKAFHTNTAEVIVAKNRSGPTGIVNLSFSPETGSFRNLIIG